MRTIFTYVALILTLSLSAQSLDREQARSVYGLYDFDIERVSERIPKGFKPFYISHYGRHGARYIYNDSEYELLYDVFTRAHASGVLTPLGKKFHDQILAVYPHFHGRAGELTRLGQSQHRMLAQRLIADYPGVFRKSTEVTAVSSVYTRCIMSMNAFCDVLRCAGVKVSEDVDGRAIWRHILNTIRNIRERIRAGAANMQSISMTVSIGQPSMADYLLTCLLLRLYRRIWISL